jgi:pimeloyl-ACP methyl ester carboxylesterase
MATGIEHRFVESNGIRMHIAEAGRGPLVLLCHGFPECWYSWRHQLHALAEAGYHAVAPDQRGYGQTDRPANVADYTMLHLVGDLVGLLDALGERRAVIGGHDWGAPVAWTAALLRPDRFRAVMALSVPFRPRGSTRPTTVMPQTSDALFYQLYFQEPGVAEAELERDVRATMRSMLYWASGDRPARSADSPGGDDVAMVPRGGGFLSRRDTPAKLPPWLSEEDLDFYTSEFSRSGFRGADRLLAAQAQLVPQLRESIVLPGCGHWTQQERPAEVNAAMLRFLGQLGGRAGSGAESSARGFPTNQEGG